MSTNKNAIRAIVDTSILDPKRVEELRAKAKAKIDKERQAAAEAQLLDQLEDEERRALGVSEAMETVTIDLAPYADRITIDNRIFFQGETKTVGAGMAAVIREMMQATWKHQSIVDGKPEDFYRRSRGQSIIPNGGVISNVLRA